MPVDDSIFQNLADRPGHLIRRLHQIHVALFLEECGENDLTPVQFGVLTVLVDGAIRDQVTIAAMIGVDRNTSWPKSPLRDASLSKKSNPGW